MTENDIYKWLPLGAGAGAGVAIGAATDNMAAWLSVGIALGAVLSFLMARHSKSD